ncbi:MAG: ATP-binding protein [Bdellovibrionota bacterium]
MEILTHKVGPVNNQTFLKCEDEPIHIPESIQPFGYLFALEPNSGSIKIHSANLNDLFRSWDSVKDQGFFDFLDEEFLARDAIQEAYQNAKAAKVRLPIEIRFKTDIVKEKAHADYFAIVYESSDLLVVEIEPAVTFKGKIASRQQTKIYSMATVPRFRTTQTITQIADSIAEMVRKFTGYERVLIYKFNPDMSGTVVAESKVEDMESYLGLFYPETDIPRQARELYKKSWLRVTANAESKPVGLVPSVKDSGRKPLDMTNSILRTMSPIHLQYLRNQGLISSMSISLYSQEELWGLIICQHRNEYYLPQDMRLEVESLAHLFSWQLYAKEEESLHTKREAADQTINEMISQIGDDKDITTIFTENEDKILSLMNACGFVFSYGDLSVSLGDTPPVEIYSKLFEKFPNRSSTRVVESVNIYKSLDRPRADNVLGALVVPLLSENNFYTIWFRKEEIVERKWAGNPHEKTVQSDKLQRLEPRQSFVIHKETVTDESRPWNVEDKRIANLFNKVFLQHALRSQVLMKSNIDLLTAQDKSKNEFLATLAHELRNPLAPISSAVELIRLDPSTETLDEASAIIERQMKQLVTLIDDLMDVSRITRGRVVLKTEKAEFHSVALHAVDSIRKLASAKGVTIVEDYQDKDAFVNADITRLTQVIANVINNAVKYTQKNGRVVVRTFADYHDAMVEVEDNGIGISKEYLPSIFEMFSQADPFSSKGTGGLGIGLTLAKKLVDLHGGTISARSQGIGKGSTFEIRLPRLGATMVQSDSAKKTAQTMNKEKKRILVVDDNFDSARMLELILKSKGHEVKKAVTGIEGLAIFHEFKPEVALLDIGIPDMDGYEICKAIRATDYGQDTLVIAQTGWGQEEHLKRSAEAGFDHHIVKPIQPALLWKILSEPRP